jgi:aspartate racemase
MKSIGLIGGLSWESTALYYRLINREIAARRGGLRSANLRLHSFDFEQVVARQKAGAWRALAAMLGQAARGLEQAGAQCVLIGSNTMHRVADEVRSAVSIPLLHIADATAVAVRRAGVRSVGLLGTRYTMEQRFYVDHLARAGILCIVPDEAERIEVHRVIFDELCQGVVNPVSRRRLRRLVQRLASRGAQGVVLGCTELPLILSPSDVDLPLFDTTALHALAGVDFALGTCREDGPQRPQRSAAVCTGASHSASVPSSSAVTVIEQPAISSEVT